MPLALDCAPMSRCIATSTRAAPVTPAYRINARRFDGSRNPALSFDVIHAQAGIHFDLALEVQCFHSPCGRAGNFSLLVQRKVTKRNTPHVARLPGILPSRSASRFRGSLSAHPCARSERARILRAPLRAFPPPARRATGGPIWAASCRRSQSLAAPIVSQVEGRAKELDSGFRRNDELLDSRLRLADT